MNFAVSINPATGDELARYPFVTAEEIDSLLKRAHAGFRAWRSMPIAERAAVMTRMSAVLLERRDALATLATREMGKPIKQSRAEVEKCASLCRWCAENAERVLADESTEIADAWISWLPTGVLLGVMPWNFPYWQAMRGAAAALAGGNAYLLKPAPNVVGCALLLEECWRAAGLPDGAFSVLNADNEATGRVIADDRITGVAVTGSPRAGAAIASQAGAALKKSVLELGGSDAFVVLADANVEAAVDAAVQARFANTGQVCIAAKRILLEEPIAAEFAVRLVDAVKKLRLDDPMDEQTFLGPLARRDLRTALEEQVSRTIAAGAEILLRGGRVDGPGNFYAPTVLADVARDAAAFCEETFGPVAAMTTVRDSEDAVALANRSVYGLNAALWTRDLDRAARLARQMECGAVFINGIPSSDPRLPIGGVKRSGYGRELSAHGMREFLNAQTVWRRRG